MEQKATFRYFYGEEADMHSFYRIPKLLFTNDYFKALSNDAKILYGLMLDRMSLSVKNQWFDEENKAYIYFSVEDIMELLNCGKNKAVENIKKYIDEHIGIVDGEKYLVVQNWYTNTDNQIGAKQDDYVVMYTNLYNNERSIEVVDPIVFNQYCKKMSGIVKADTV